MSSGRHARGSGAGPCSGSGRSPASLAPDQVAGRILTLPPWPGILGSEAPLPGLNGSRYHLLLHLIVPVPQGAESILCSDRCVIGLQTNLNLSVESINAKVLTLQLLIFLKDWTVEVNSEIFEQI